MKKNRNRGSKQRVTLRLVNEELRRLGYRDVELVRGYGYYYWSGGIAGRFREQGVYAARLNDLSLTWWVNDFKSRVKEVRSR